MMLIRLSYQINLLQKGIEIMPYFYMKEIRTPLKLVGIRLFKCQETGQMYMKVRENGRRLIMARQKQK